MGSETKSRTLPKKDDENTKINKYLKEEIKHTAISTLQIEADTISGLIECINDNFCRNVTTLFESKGRLVVTGIGKSALVGQKIVATMNSTGTPALFMHAADAIHGDLGMIRPDDIVLAISKSGSSSEIKILVPLVKNLGNLLAGMVSSEDSFLAKQADMLFLTPVSKEADPNNLAPTASTAAQMAMGDAIATSLLALRGFSPQDFAQYHPGGALGKQLYLRVSDIYPNNERPVVYSGDGIRQTIIEMTSKRLGTTVVLNKEEKLLGIITDGDLRRMLESQKDVAHLTAKDILTKNPKTIQKDALAVKALQIMRSNSITQVIVMDGDKYEGIVHLHDLIREGLI